MDCHDCGAKVGELHDHGCDVECCPLCGGQLIACGCVYIVNGIDPVDLKDNFPMLWDNGPTDSMYKNFDDEIERLGGYLPWMGDSPGTQECIEFGWYSRFVDKETGKPFNYGDLKRSGKWEKCDKHTEGAGPDLNRLVTECKWNKYTRRWEKIS